MNKAILIGNLGGDPDVRRMQDGRPIVTFSMATSESWKDKATGERKQHTDWHRVVIFNEGLCAVAERFLKKGSKVAVEGAMKTRKWTDQSNIDRWVTEVVLSGFQCSLQLLDRAERAPAPTEDAYGAGDVRTAAPAAAPTAAGAQPASRQAELDDEIPF